MTIKTCDDMMIFSDSPFLNQKVKADIQAILTVLGRRNSEFDKTNRFIDLSFTNLCGANLNANYIKGITNQKTVNFNNFLFDNSILAYCDCSYVNFESSVFNKTSFDFAKLDFANFSFCWVYRSSFYYAHCENCNFQYASLQFDYLRNSRNVSPQLFISARSLYGSEFDDQNFINDVGLVNKDIEKYLISIEEFRNSL